MKVNFDLAECQTPVPLALFGLCDDGDSSKAYVERSDPRKWIATIENNQEVALTFTAFDKCVIHDHQYPGRGRCDGLLRSPDHLYFIELKDQGKGWVADAIEQLSSTIQFFSESHDLKLFKHKKAFACNRRHKHFQEIDNELNLKFFRRNKVRLDVQATVIVIS